MERVCERCAGEDDDLVLVRPPAAAAGDGRGSSGPAELWCDGCRSSTAHEEVDDSA